MVRVGTSSPTFAIGFGGNMERISEKSAAAVTAFKQRVYQATAGVQYAKGDKICPFQSAANSPVRCSSECMLFRAKKVGYECPLSELSVIAFSAKMLQG